MKQKRWKSLAMVVVALVIVVTLLAPSGVADERRLVVSVDEPFEINGELYPKGEVSVKSVRSYNPSSLLSEIWVGRKCLGLFRASKISGESSSTENTLTFTRSAEGHLTLVGFASGNRADHGVYRFRLQAQLVEPERDVFDQ
jgi:hypothetical protein